MRERGQTSGQTGQTPGRTGQTRRRLDAGEARDGGAARKTPTGHGRGRSWARWRALAGVHRVVVEAGPTVAGDDDGELQGGGQRSAMCGVWAAACKREN